MHGYQEYASLKNKYPSSVMMDARYLNDWMPVHMVDLLESALHKAHRNLKGSLVCVLGFSFLENSDDARNTPTAPFLKELENRGADYRVHDPLVREDDTYHIETDLDAALKDCDAVVLMTKHDDYKAVTPEKLKNLSHKPVVVDGRGFFVPAAFMGEGFVFKGVGQGNVNSIEAGSRKL